MPEERMDPDAEAGADDDEFYESLDRILSSSCSSTSASDDDAAAAGDHHRRRRRLPPPLAVAAAASSFDIWISEPSSVEERRRRLLHRMGLASDPSLSRAKSSSSSSSAADERPLPQPDAEAADELARSRSGSSGKPPLGRNPSAGDEQRRIKNLDDGTEFEVGELREDQVRELGTGRQLTLEEFELCVGRSPIVQELMRRATSPDCGGGCSSGATTPTGDSKANGGKSRKKNSWLRSIKHMAGNVVAAGYNRSSDRKDKDSAENEKAAVRRLSSATDDSLDGSGSGSGSRSGAERIRVRQYGKSYKELTGVFMTQEVDAHHGSIWCIKFSLDGRYLASAGEDRVIKVWEVSETERKAQLFGDGSARDNGGCSPFLAVIGSGSPEMALSLSCIEGSFGEKKRRPRIQSSRKSVGSDHLVVPECMLSLGDKPVISLQGHAADVLDLSWSKSQYLLSSSMDKTVKLWNITSNTCLKTFSHSDYVTCIQFNPVDDRFFISGSLDEKVRIWSVPDRQVVDWNDLHEMVTAACYTPDGQGALVGSHKGSCHLFDTSENKLQYKSQIELKIKKKKSSQKKITGFQFAPGSSSEVLITSADSRIRVVNGDELVHRFKGFRNTSSQISASVAPNGKYVVCASEDSHVYVWRHDSSSQPSRSKGAVDVTQSYEHFHCHDVTVAITWPGAELRGSFGSHSSRRSDPDEVVRSNQEVPIENSELDSSVPMYRCSESPLREGILNTSTNHLGDRATATWPEEKLPTPKHNTAQNSPELCHGAMEVQNRSAWGLVIVTAGRGGEIRVFQNFGFPVHV